MSTPSSNLLATHANCLPVGTVIADFEIIGLVGEGGFGIVYLARDINLDRVVALKEFMPSSFAGRVDGVQVAVRSTNHRATYEAGLRSFINEAKMLARFAHPALVEVYRFWEGNGTAYMAMRFYSGETLRQHLANDIAAFDEQAIAQVMSPIFDALEMLHREQVYHRDIAPDNIMLSDGHPVLLDFGSARRIIGDGTQALTTVLKPGYAPIEQYVDDGTMKQGPWTDVYALGGVLYHLSTGKAPLQAVSRLLSDPLLPVAEVVGDRFSETFSHAVSKAMAVRVEDRLQNVREFRELLGWEAVKSSRVMTLPSAAYAPRTGEVSPIDGRVTGGAPEPVVQTRLGPNTSGGPKTKLLQAQSEPLIDFAVGGDRPVHPVEATPKKEMVVPLITVGLGVVAIAAYFLTRAPDPVAAIPAQPPISAAVAAASKDVPLPAAVVVSTALPATSAQAAIPETGVLKLDISPWGTVVIDGVTRGISNSTQLRQIELKVGTHTIEIAKPDAPPLRQTIEVTASAPVTISHKFK